MKTGFFIGFPLGKLLTSRKKTPGSAITRTQIPNSEPTKRLSPCFRFRTLQDSFLLAKWIFNRCDNIVCKYMRFYRLSQFRPRIACCAGCSGLREGRRALAHHSTDTHWLQATKGQIGLLKAHHRQAINVLTKEN